MRSIESRAAQRRADLLKELKEAGMVGWDKDMAMELEAKQPPLDPQTDGFWVTLCCVALAAGLIIGMLLAAMGFQV